MNEEHGGGRMRGERDVWGLNVWGSPVKRVPFGTLILMEGARERIESSEQVCFSEEMKTSCQGEKLL